jgi:two-component system nitrogen regulation response regulator GlnG
VDDETDLRSVLELLLNREGFECLLAENGPEALAIMRQGLADLVLLDINMPVMDGLTVFREAKAFDSVTPIIFVTGFGTIASAVEAVKMGAYDYITKPFAHEELLIKIRRGLETRRLKHENRLLRQQVEREGTLRQLMGPSDAVGALVSDLERVAPTDFTVIVTGETGAGKELIARAIHQNSLRSAGPFVPVDCGAIQPNLIESELFGHEKGAFTGADRTRPGRFEEAIGGTLFLDEIQNLPLSVQTRFLRTLQERQFSRVGSTKPIEMDLRVVVATNLNLEELITAGTFRQDLFHRLNEFGIRVPPLRERSQDILFLAHRFIEFTAAELRKARPTMTSESINKLLSYPWPGNVRELRNVLRRAVLMCDGVIEVAHLGAVGTFTPINLVPGEEQKPTLDLEEMSFKERVKQAVARAERAILLEVLRQTGGNKAKAARLLQIDYKTMRTKARQYGIVMQFPDRAGADSDEDEEISGHE